VNRIAAAYLAACRDELAAPKPGNVHRFAAGHGMTVADFARSAEASAPHIAASGQRLGARILAAVTATQEAVAMNTNLGIILCCAPLAMAAEGGALTSASVQPILAAASVADSDAVFAAIRLANPAGLGTAPAHDVRQPASVQLLAAMREAAGRDTIAYLYAQGFQPVFDAVQYLRARRRANVNPNLPIAGTYLRWMSQFPDSHVARKHGALAARRLQAEAKDLLDQVIGINDFTAALPLLLEADSRLKQEGINPGTSADLTVATLFADKLG
jgi:triphosphoribosyl-dephospho-CoA synthase